MLSQACRLRTFDSADGTLDLEKLEQYFHTDADVHHPRTTPRGLENTHNYCGGVVYRSRRSAPLREFCDRHGMILHLDGARSATPRSATRRLAARHTSRPSTR